MPGVPWLQWMNFHYSDGRHRNALKAHFFVARSSDFGVALTSLRHAVNLDEACQIAPIEALRPPAQTAVSLHGR